MSAETCLVFVGPTAVGKTSLIVKLARHHALEVISLDSRQIYRGLRIGTAQPSQAEQADCPHHLIDFHPPDQSYSVARYRDDFRMTYREIRSRGRIPVLVGGAGFYLTAVREGLFSLPGISEGELARVRAELDDLDADAIRHRLAAVDPASCDSIHPNDRYRSQRALEIHILSGRPLSELKREHRPTPCLGLQFPICSLSLPVAELDARIAARTEAMLTAGWLDETEALLASYGPEAVGLKTLGYREVIQHLQGQMSREDLIVSVTMATRQYAKRQRTWFRSLPRTSEGRPDVAETEAVAHELLMQASAS